MPWPKLPAVAHTRWGRPSSETARYSVPRPLKERIGLRVSTLTTRRQPSCCSSDSARNWGESRNTGSMTAAACAIRSRDSRFAIRRIHSRYAAACLCQRSADRCTCMVHSNPPRGGKLRPTHPRASFDRARGGGYKRWAFVALSGPDRQEGQDMKRVAAMVVLVAVAASFSLALAGEAAKQAEVSYTGWIVDSYCGGKNANADQKSCVLDCFKKGAKLVLYVPDAKKSISLDKQDQASQHIGVSVKITGIMDGETLKVSKIEEVKAS